MIYRLLSALPVIVLVSIFVFLLLRLGTGNPAIILAGDAATPETIAATDGEFEDRRGARRGTEIAEAKMRIIVIIASMLRDIMS